MLVLAVLFSHVGEAKGQKLLICDFEVVKKYCAEMCRVTKQNLSAYVYGSGVDF